MNSLKSIYRKLEGQCLDPLFMWGVEEDTEAYEFECDSLSQECYVESLNETESLLKETFEMEIKHVEGGNWNLNRYREVEKEMFELREKCKCNDVKYFSLIKERAILEKSKCSGEYVLLKNYNVVERGTYEECNATLNDYVEIYEWINEMSNKK